MNEIQPLGKLRLGSYFRFIGENTVYKVGHYITGTCGYIACSNQTTKKVTRVYFETRVVEVGEPDDDAEIIVNEYRCVRCFGIFDVIVKNGKPTIDNCPFCNGDLVCLSEKGR